MQPAISLAGRPSYSGKKMVLMLSRLKPVLSRTWVLKPNTSLARERSYWPQPTDGSSVKSHTTKCRSVHSCGYITVIPLQILRTSTLKTAVTAAGRRLHARIRPKSILFPVSRIPVLHMQWDIQMKSKSRIKGLL